MFRNLGNGKFEDVTDTLGAEFASPVVARGAAYGDIYNDGALDLLVSTNDGPVHLFRNVGTTNNSLRIKLVGTKSNRDGIGTVVRVTAGNDIQSKTLSSGSSYLSSSELILTFGLATHARADAIDLYWPSGQTDHLISIAANQIITVKEGQGIVTSRALAKRP